MQLTRREFGIRATAFLFTGFSAAPLSMSNDNGMKDAHPNAVSSEISYLAAKNDASPYTRQAYLNRAKKQYEMEDVWSLIYGFDIAKINAFCQRLGKQLGLTEKETSEKFSHFNLINANTTAAIIAPPEIYGREMEICVFIGPQNFKIHHSEEDFLSDIDRYHQNAQDAYKGFHIGNIFIDHQIARNIRGGTWVDITEVRGYDNLFAKIIEGKRNPSNRVAAAYSLDYYSIVQRLKQLGKNVFYEDMLVRTLLGETRTYPLAPYVIVGRKTGVRREFAPTRIASLAQEKPLIL
ncbi:MAG: hypothetical protein HY514_01210 [Candidatus Aenigmarchaeota archaeon]|nr:hypothetical protein [Candidatus Aenigmarchaeota archaeon]